MPRALWWPWWWGLFHISEVPLYSPTRTTVLLEEHCPEALERVSESEREREADTGIEGARGRVTHSERECVCLCAREG